MSSFWQSSPVIRDHHPMLRRSWTPLPASPKSSTHQLPGPGSLWLEPASPAGVPG